MSGCIPDWADKRLIIQTFLVCGQHPPGDVVFIRGTSSPGPPYTLPRGGPSAPRRSRGSLRSARSLSAIAGLRLPLPPADFVPRDPLTRSLAGAPLPRPVAWLTSLRSFALCNSGTSSSSFLRRTSSPGPPYTLPRGGPSAPRRSRGSLRSVRSLSAIAGLRLPLPPGDFVPRDPLTRSLAGAPLPRPVAGLTSLRSFALCNSGTSSSSFLRRTSSPGPPYTLPRGGPSAPPGRGAHFAPLVRSLNSGTSSPGPHYTRTQPWPAVAR